MHAIAVLQKCLSDVLERMHQARSTALLGAVSALLVGRRLVLMDMARSWPGAERVRAPLKRLDRLLSNPHLQAEAHRLYAGMAQYLWRSAQPIIVVDWSDLPRGQGQLLRAGVPMGGRTLTLLQELYPNSQKNSPRAERRFLHQLSRLVPEGIQPIVVTDAGFRRPWFQAVKRLGWHYVGRMRDRARVELTPGHWSANQALYAQAKTQPRRFTQVRIAQRAPWRCDLVLYRRTPRGRTRLTRRGTRSLDGKSLKAARREREPWLLVTSLTQQHCSAREVVAFYAQRMQIEESFRDLKSDRLGCGFVHSFTRCLKRLAVLLLIHALACFVAWLTGQALQKHAPVIYGGVRSCRGRAHYSLLRLGWEALRRGDRLAQTSRLWRFFIHWRTTPLKLLGRPA